MKPFCPAASRSSTLEPVRAKDGHITLHLRVDGPHDRSVDLVRNLEHSRRFLEPRIVGESSAETGTGPNQRLEPVSASNRFDFDLLAEYNPPLPGETQPTGNLKKPLAGTNSDDGSANSGSAPRVHGTPRPFPLHRPCAKTEPHAQLHTQLHRRRPAMSNSLPASSQPASSQPASSKPAPIRAESLRSPLTWHYAGFALLLVLVIGLSIRLGLDWAATNTPLHRCPRRQAD